MHAAKWKYPLVSLSMFIHCSFHVYSLLPVINDCLKTKLTCHTQYELSGKANRIEVISPISLKDRSDSLSSWLVCIYMRCNACIWEAKSSAGERSIINRRTLIPITKWQHITHTNAKNTVCNAWQSSTLQSLTNTTWGTEGWIINKWVVSEARCDKTETEQMENEKWIGGG